MWVDSIKAHVSLLRDEVSRREPSIDRNLLTRKNCLAWLASHGINELPTTEYDQARTIELYSRVNHEVEQRDIGRSYVFTNNYTEIENNSAGPVQDESKRYSFTEYSGMHDITYRSVNIQHDMNVGSLIIHNENIVELLSNIMFDIREMNQVLVNMRAEVQSFNTDTDSKNDNEIVMSSGQTFPFEHNNEYGISNDYCEYFMQSGIIHVHMSATIDNNDQGNPGRSMLSVRLPFPVHSKPFFRARIHNDALDTTIAKVFPQNDQLFVSSYMLERTHLPVHVSIDGVYTTDTHQLSDITWITPMRFDERRDAYINPNDVTIHTGLLSFEKGSMQWNVIEQSTKLNTNITLRATTPMHGENRHHVVINLPDSNETLHTENTPIVYGYGSVLLLPMYRHSAKHPIVYVDTSNKTLNIIIEIVAPEVDTIIVSTHVVYYRQVSLTE